MESLIALKGDERSEATYEAVRRSVGTQPYYFIYYYMLGKQDAVADNAAHLPTKRIMPTGRTEHHKKSLFLLRAGQNCV